MYMRNLRLGKVFCLYSKVSGLRTYSEHSIGISWHDMALGIGGMTLSVWELLMCRKGSYSAVPARQT